MIELVSKSGRLQIRLHYINTNMTAGVGYSFLVVLYQS